jgi:diguanylate cyclase (GGDEF)-like protein/PAS domain S-box-containing protein
LATIENRPFNELKVGDSASLTRTLREQDIKLFAVMSGDVNPAHVDEVYAKSDMFHRVIAHGMWSGTLISTVLGTLLPGPGAIYLNQSLHFLHPVGLDDIVTVTVRVTELHPENHRVKLDCIVTNQRNEQVVTGVAEVLAPTEKIVRPRIELPEVHLIHGSDNPQQLVGDALLSKALTCTASAIFIVDRGGRIVWVNDAFSRLTGYSTKEIIGSTPAILKSGKQNDEFYMELWQTILAGHVWRGTMVDRRKDDSLYNVDEVITPLLDEQGNITHFIAIQHDMTLRKQEDERNRYLAYHDILTGLPNRALFLNVQRQAMSHAKHSQHMLALLFLDIDGFKAINDTFGHGMGDQLLVAVAERLRTAVRKADVVARLGGDEFAILLTSLGDAQTARTVAHKLLDTLSQPFVLGEQKIHTHASIGIAIYPADGEESEILLANADKAMYRAKKEGGNSCQIHCAATSGP